VQAVASRNTAPGGRFARPQPADSAGVRPAHSARSAAICRLKTNGGRARAEATHERAPVHWQ